MEGNNKRDFEIAKDPARPFIVKTAAFSGASSWYLLETIWQN
jgi:hypothetical protein